ncbi:hypothetical protein H920_07670 [Fukomys damarensis]|uniref:Uncharacterized protein n=1 Tax=Fukomys damarensis TaxID=885580 RepID=A0A091DFK8_FUKDA|nr:hypothetical protein H920_07670 [Fukomys damarensis]
MGVPATPATWEARWVPAHARWWACHAQQLRGKSTNLRAAPPSNAVGPKEEWWGRRGLPTVGSAYHKRSTPGRASPMNQQVVGTGIGSASSSASSRSAAGQAPARSCGSEVSEAPSRRNVGHSSLNASSSPVRHVHTILFSPALFMLRMT